MADVFEHIKNPELLRNEAFRVLAPHGLAIFSFPNERGIKGWLDLFVASSDRVARSWKDQVDGWFHLWYFTPKIAKEFLGRNWTIESEHPYWGRIVGRLPLIERFPSTSSSVMFVCRKAPNDA